MTRANYDHKRGCRVALGLVLLATAILGGGCGDAMASDRSIGTEDASLIGAYVPGGEDNSLFTLWRADVVFDVPKGVYVAGPVGGIAPSSVYYLVDENLSRKTASIRWFRFAYEGDSPYGTLPSVECAVFRGSGEGAATVLFGALSQSHMSLQWYDIAASGSALFVGREVSLRFKGEGSFAVEWPTQPSASRVDSLTVPGPSAAPSILAFEGWRDEARVLLRIQTEKAGSLYFARSPGEDEWQQVLRRE